MQIGEFRLEKPKRRFVVITLMGARRWEPTQIVELERRLCLLKVNIDARHPRKAIIPDVTGLKLERVLNEMGIFSIQLEVLCSHDAKDIFDHIISAV